MKTCGVCFKRKFAHEFHRNSSALDKRAPYCKPCRSKWMKIWNNNRKVKCPKCRRKFRESCFFDIKGLRSKMCNNCRRKLNKKSPTIISCLSCGVKRHKKLFHKSGRGRRSMCKFCTSKYGKIYRKTLPNKNKSYSSYRNRIESLILLGGCCKRCGFKDWRALQVDHVKGNGADERRKLKNCHRHRIFILEKLLKGSKDYQLLCANCNWIKKYEEKEV